MGIKKYFFVGFVLLVFFGCTKNSEPETVVSKFESTVVVNYNSDTVRIGDTIWVESTIQGYLFDSVLNRNVHFKKAHIYLNMVLRSWNLEFSEIDDDLYGFDFETYVDYKTMVGNATILGFYYKEEEGKFKIKYGIIFNKKGTFSIDTDNLVLHNYFTDSELYYGSGHVELEDIVGEYKSGYLSCNIEVESRNMHLYNELSNNEKALFDPIEESNNEKYFFVKVLE